MCSLFGLSNGAMAQEEQGRFGFGPPAVALDGRAPGVGGPTPPEAPAALRPTTNLYGMTGLIDMPTAETAASGELGTSITYFGKNLRNTLTFQISPRLSGAFRYAAFFDWKANGFDTYYDRSFDLKYQVRYESDWLPAIAIGLQDFVGTGISAGEYVVATKTLAPGLTGTVGLGWGRLGSYKPIGTPFGGKRGRFRAGGTGGQFSLDQWFRGPAAPFAGLEYRRGKWGLKAEYSSDAYTTEAGLRRMFKRSSPYNFGLEYRVSDGFLLGAYSMYGDTVGLQLSFSNNPNRARIPLLMEIPRVIAPRPDIAQSPEAWDVAWSAAPDARDTLLEALRPLLAADRFDLIALNVQTTQVEVRVQNTRFRSEANAIGRVARALAATMPASVETFHIVLMESGLPRSRVSLRRSDLEGLEATPNRAEELWPLVQISSAAQTPRADLVEGRYPRAFWAISQYTESSLFDPRNPVMIRLGVRARAGYELLPGLRIEGELRKPLIGNLENIRVSNSKLPKVRTDAGRYAATQDVTLEQLYASYSASLGNDYYVRGTVGILEKMYGGISGEVLWKPANSRLGLGAELNYVRKRDFDQRLAFRNYSVLTGHVSAYYQARDDVAIQLDVGRYLAGDIGSTLIMERRFANGWRVGGFATITNVSAAQFGEGSFDKGIFVSVPLNWGLGRPTRLSTGSVLRPVQRDGGARVFVPGRLYERVRDAHTKALKDDWARVWR